MSKRDYKIDDDDKDDKYKSKRLKNNIYYEEFYEMVIANEQLNDLILYACTRGALNDDVKTLFSNNRDKIRKFHIEEALNNKNYTLLLYILTLRKEFYNHVLNHLYMLSKNLEIAKIELQLRNTNMEKKIESNNDEVCFLDRIAKDNNGVMYVDFLKYYDNEDSGFIYFCRHGNLEMVNYIISESKDLDNKFVYYHGLSEALKHKHINIVNYIIEKTDRLVNINVESVEILNDIFNTHPMIVASYYYDDVQLFMTLFKYFGVTNRNFIDDCLHSALKHRNYSVASNIIRNGYGDVLNTLYSMYMYWNGKTKLDTIKVILSTRSHVINLDMFKIEVFKGLCANSVFDVYDMVKEMNIDVFVNNSGWLLSTACLGGNMKLIEYLKQKSGQNYTVECVLNALNRRHIELVVHILNTDRRLLVVTEIIDTSDFIEIYPRLNDECKRVIKQILLDMLQNYQYIENKKLRGLLYSILGDDILRTRETLDGKNFVYINDILTFDYYEILRKLFPYAKFLVVVDGYKLRVISKDTNLEVGYCKTSEPSILECQIADMLDAGMDVRCLFASKLIRYKNYKLQILSKITNMNVDILEHIGSFISYRPGGMKNGVDDYN